MIDANLRRMLEEMRESYLKIMLIFNEVTNQSIQEKLTKIDESRKAILDIEAQVKLQDQHMKDLHSHVLEAQVSTVSLEALNSKIEFKFMRHFEKKISQSSAANDEMLGTTMI